MFILNKRIKITNISEPEFDKGMTLDFTRVKNEALFVDQLAVNQVENKLADPKLNEISRQLLSCEDCNYDTEEQCDKHNEV